MNGFSWCGNYFCYY